MEGELAEGQEGVPEQLAAGVCPLSKYRRVIYIL